MAETSLIDRKLREDVEVLAGRRGAAALHAVRFGDLGNARTAVAKAVTKLAEQATGAAGGVAAEAKAAAAEVAEALLLAEEAINTLEGNAAALLSILTPEIDGSGKVAGIRAIAFNNAAQGIESSLLQLIGDNVVAEGTLSTNKLVVGLGKNLLSNSRFRHGTTRWTREASGAAGAETTLAVRPAGSTWAAAFYPTLMLHQAGFSTTGVARAVWTDLTSAGGTAVLGVPVSPGQVLEASANLSTHRCAAAVEIRFLDAAGVALTPVASSETIASTPSTSSQPDLWPRPYVIAQVPAGAAYATLAIRKEPTLAEGDSYVFVHKPMLAETHSAATLPSPYSDDGATLIGPDGIVTAAITADKIAANAITAGKIAAGAIIADKIAVNAITTAKIILGGVETTNLADFAATKVSSGGNPLVVSHVPGATITLWIISNGGSFTGEDNPTLKTVTVTAAVDGVSIGQSASFSAIVTGQNVSLPTLVGVLTFTASGSSSSISVSATGMTGTMLHRIVAFESKR